jgi:hypothetical protein
MFYRSLREQVLLLCEARIAEMKVWTDEAHVL